MTFWRYFAPALVASVAIHGVADMWVASPNNTVRVAGTAKSQIAMLGNSTSDLFKASRAVTAMTPDHVRAVQPPKRTPPEPNVKTKVIEPVQPVSAELAPTTENALPVVASAQPERIVAQNAISKPTEPSQAIEPVETTLDPVESIAPPTASAVALTDGETHSVRPTQVTSVLSPVQAKPVQAKPAQRQPELQPIERVTPKGPVESQTSARGSPGTSEHKAKKGSAHGRALASREADGKHMKARKASLAGNASVSDYQAKIRRKIRASLIYPSEARAIRSRGRVVVRFVVTSNGRISSIGVARSSGSRHLDTAALATVRRSAPFPKIPAAAGRRSWPFIISLNFRP